MYSTEDGENIDEMLCGSVMSEKDEDFSDSSLIDLQLETQLIYECVQIVLTLSQGDLKFTEKLVRKTEIIDLTVNFLAKDDFQSLLDP